MFELAPLIVPLVLAGFGVKLASTGITTWRRTRTALRRAREPIGTARGSVRIAGRVMPSEAGTVTAPISGRECVWVRVRVDEPRGKGGWETLFTDVHSRPFILVEGEHRARIDPERAEVVAHEHPFGGLELDADVPPPAMLALIESHGVPTKGLFGLVRRFRAIEERIEPEANLTAVGDAERVETAMPTGDYREPVTELVLSKHAAPWLTTKDDDFVLRRSLRDAGRGGILLAFAVVLFACFFTGFVR